MILGHFGKVKTGDREKISSGQGLRRREDEQVEHTICIVVDNMPL